MKVWIEEEERWPDYLVYLEAKKRADYELDLPDELVKDYLLVQKHYDALSKEIREIIERSEE